MESQGQDFLQSNEWLEFQKSLGREVFEYKKEGISANIIKHRLPLGKSYLYIPHGPEIDFNAMSGGFKNPVNNFVKELRELARQHKAIFVKAEPLLDNIAQALVGGGKFSAGGGPAFGWKKSKKQVQPQKTVIVDLTKSEDELLTEMHHKTRYNIKVAESHEVKVSESNDIGSFLSLLKKTTERDKFSSHPGEYYKKLLNFKQLNIKLFLSYIGDENVAGALVLVFDNTGYYLHGASDYNHRASMAPYALHWHIAKSLKDQGINNYDLWGIDANKWPGVTRFKLGWGGKTIEYPGPFDLTISNFWHLLYKLVKMPS